MKEEAKKIVASMPGPVCSGPVAPFLITKNNFFMTKVFISSQKKLIKELFRCYGQTISDEAVEKLVKKAFQSHFKQHLLTSLWQNLPLIELVYADKRAARFYTINYALAMDLSAEFEEHGQVKLETLEKLLTQAFKQVKK